MDDRPAARELLTNLKRDHEQNAAEVDKPITVRQLAAYHTQGDTALVAWHRKGSTTKNTMNQMTENRTMAAVTVMALPSRTCRS